MITQAKSISRPSSRLGYNPKHETLLKTITKTKVLSHRVPSSKFVQQNQDKENRVPSEHKKQSNFKIDIKDLSQKDLRTNFEGKSKNAKNIKIYFQTKTFHSTLKEQEPQTLEAPLLSNQEKVRLKPKCHDNKNSKERDISRKSIDKVKERISTENSKNEQNDKRRRKSIGEDAYVPFNIKVLKQKVLLRTKDIR